MEEPPGIQHCRTSADFGSTAFDSMLNSSIESAVMASSASSPSEKAASAPAEPATSDT